MTEQHMDTSIDELNHWLDLLMKSEEGEDGGHNAHTQPPTMLQQQLISSYYTANES